MSTDEFRRAGREMIDWIADYLETVEDRPVLAPVAPGDVRAMLPDSPPVQGESFGDMMADVERIVMPGITHWQSPRFFGYFPSNISGPSILGELLSAGLGVQGMLWSTSPACTELETHMLDWLVDMLGLPRQFLSATEGGGVIQDTASSATLCAMIAARERITEGHINEHGHTDKRLVAYTSQEAHSSVEKAAKIIGIGRENLRLIETDDTFAMDPAALEAAIDADVAAGHTPFFVSATVGTTSSNAMDPLPAIAAITAKHDRLWFHVDAAMSGTAALCPELRGMHDGLEHADSYCFNPHKWMFTNFDCDCFYVARRADLIGALSILPEYLRNQATESGEVFDYRDWQIPLGRRFRALKLWFVIRHYGVEGLQQLIREHVRLTRLFATWVEEHEDFEVVTDPPLNLVCFRHVGGDGVNEQLLTKLNAGGRVYLTHTRLDDAYVLRMSIGGAHLTEALLAEAWDEIKRQAASM